MAAVTICSDFGAPSNKDTMFMMSFLPQGLLGAFMDPLGECYLPPPPPSDAGETLRLREEMDLPKLRRGKGARMEVEGPELHSAGNGLRCRGRALPCGVSRWKPTFIPGTAVPCTNTVTHFSHQLAQKVSPFDGTAKGTQWRWRAWPKASGHLGHVLWFQACPWHPALLWRC